MAAIWKAAKTLDLPQSVILDAVYDLTRTDRREAYPLRDELREDVWRVCCGILGLPPEHSTRQLSLHDPNDLMGEGARRRLEEYRRRKTEGQEQGKNRGGKGR